MSRHGLVTQVSTFIGLDAEVDAGGRRFGYEGDKRKPKAFRVVRDVKLIVEVEMKVKHQVLKR